jgi:enoyl-CoA hydratase/carnithine racemase
LQESYRIFKTIRFSTEGSKARIVLNRPRAGNRVNLSMAQELAEATQLINHDDSIRVITLTGEGKSFSSGWERIHVVSTEELSRHRAAWTVARIQKPVVAAINGDAIGQGLELALAADIRIAATTAHFSMPQVRFGVMPWDGGTQRLPRLVGRANALVLLLTGVLVDATEALRMGLVHQVVEPHELEAATYTAAQQIASAALVAERYSKEAVMKGMDMTLDQGLHLEADLNILLHSTGDRAEGIRSFLERRPPRFRGE